MQIDKLLDEFGEAFKRYCGQKPWPALLDALKDGMNAQYRSGTKHEKMTDDRFFQFCGDIAFPDVPEMAQETARILKICFLLGRAAV